MTTEVPVNTPGDKSVLIGYMVLAQVDSMASVLEHPEVAAEFLAGDHDHAVSTALTASAAQAGLIVTQHVLRVLLDDKKAQVRRWINGSVRAVMKVRAAQAKASFCDMNKPAPEGTVAELAERYGKSKSEIRRLKAAGQLHTLRSGE